jgi:hypothetical protein
MEAMHCQFIVREKVAADNSLPSGAPTYRSGLFLAAQIFHGRNSKFLMIRALRFMPRLISPALSVGAS